MCKFETGLRTKKCKLKSGRDKSFSFCTTTTHSTVQRNFLSNSKAFGAIEVVKQIAQKFDIPQYFRKLKQAPGPRGWPHQTSIPFHGKESL